MFFFVLPFQDAKSSSSRYLERVLHIRHPSPLDATVDTDTPTLPFTLPHTSHKTPWEIYHDINSHS